MQIHNPNSTVTMNIVTDDDGNKREYILKQKGSYRVSNLNEPCGSYLTTTSAMKLIDTDKIIHILELGVNESHLDIVRAVIPSNGMILDRISLSNLLPFSPDM